MCEDANSAFSSSHTHTHSLPAGCRQTFLEGDSLAKLVAFIGNKVSQAEEEAPW